MLSDSLDVVHHAWNIRKYKVILPLKNIIRRPFRSPDDECVVDESRSERFDRLDFSLNLESRNDF